PVPVHEALRIALHTLRQGLDADEVALVADAHGLITCRGYASAAGGCTAWADGPGCADGTGSTGRTVLPARTAAVARAAFDRDAPDGVAVATSVAPVVAPASHGTLRTGGGQPARGLRRPGTEPWTPGTPAAADRQYLTVSFGSPDGRTVLVAG